MKIMNVRLICQADGAMVIFERSIEQFYHAKINCNDKIVSHRCLPAVSTGDWSEVSGFISLWAVSIMDVQLYPLVI
jgi:hypothetical protein